MSSLLHRIFKAGDEGFLQFLINKEFHESGTGTECMGTQLMAASKSREVRVISEIRKMTAVFCVSFMKNLFGLSVFSVINGSLNTESHSDLSISLIS